jgi:glucose-1-phosphate cytidylyltransferase
MKAIILAGGFGTRISEETDNKPKPMILIDDRPIIWHIMNTCATQGINEFIIALGYKGEVIKNWVSTFQEKNIWNVKTLDTGLNTQTGGRLAKCMAIYASNERVLATYGDGLANIRLNQLIDFHVAHGKLATVTAVRPPARFGHLHLEGTEVKAFGEKNQAEEGWISGGFFILEPGVSQFIGSESESFEYSALPELARKGQLRAYKHEGFWQPMDTLRERNDLTKLAKESPPPWLRDLVN